MDTLGNKLYGKEWWKDKNKSKELTIGWLYNNRIRNDFANGYTQNLTDYWSIEMSFFLPNGFEDDSIDALLKKAHGAGFKKMLVLKQGTTLQGNFHAEFKKFYNKNISAKLVGHILDQQDDYYSIHPQAFFIDLEWWEKVGFPFWGDREDGNNNEFETIEPIRSDENWHDEYTPHWVRQSDKLKLYKNKREGWNIIKSAIEDGITIISWNKEIRENKHYSYPEVEYDGPRHLAGVIKQCSIQEIFFIANTEEVRPFDFYINQKKLTSPEWNGQFGQVIAPAAGISSLIYAFMLGVPKYGSLVIYDISAFALQMTKQIIEEWNGHDYCKFANNLIDSNTPEGVGPSKFFRGRDQLKESELVIEKLNKSGFASWIENVLPTLHTDYIELDMLNPHHHKRFIRSINTSGPTYIHLTNIFHYMPTAFYYGLKQRHALQNEILHAIKTTVVNNDNVLVYSMDPLVLQSPINWINNRKTDISHKDLPASSIGKFLKWNNTN